MSVLHHRFRSSTCPLSNPIVDRPLSLSASLFCYSHVFLDKLTVQYITCYLEWQMFRVLQGMERSWLWRGYRSQIFQSGKTCFYGVFHVCSRGNGRVRKRLLLVRYFDHDDKGKETRLHDSVLDFVLNKFYVVLEFGLFNKTSFETSKKFRNHIGPAMILWKTHFPRDFRLHQKDNNMPPNAPMNYIQTGNHVLFQYFQLLTG